jgi:hypothetical protein
MLLGKTLYTYIFSDRMFSNFYSYMIYKLLKKEWN